jgi:hypothetical protein
MIRAGVCLDCAVPVYEQILQHRELGFIMIKIPPCTGSCYEAIEHYLANPMAWKLKLDPPFGCAGTARHAKPRNFDSASACIAGGDSKKRFRH